MKEKKKGFKLLRILDIAIQFIPIISAVFFYLISMPKHTDFYSAPEMLVPVVAGIAPILLLKPGKEFQTAHDALIAGAGFGLFFQFLLNAVFHDMNTKSLIITCVAAAVSLAIGISYFLLTLGMDAELACLIISGVSIVVGFVCVCIFDEVEPSLIFSCLLVDAVTTFPTFTNEDDSQASDIPASTKGEG